MPKSAYPRIRMHVGAPASNASLPAGEHQAAMQTNTSTRIMTSLASLFAAASLAVAAVAVACAC